MTNDTRVMSLVQNPNMVNSGTEMTYQDLIDPRLLLLALDLESLLKLRG